jgi:hypothetical protein
MARDRYRSFRLTHLGRKLVALAEDTARYAALSRAGVPAVAALAHELLTRFPEVAANHFAKQALGAFVGNVMRSRGHTIVRRGRVPGNFFSYRALWSGLPESTVAAA